MARWKLVEEKLKNLNRNITFEEMRILLEHYGYELDNKGKSSGSRIRFVCENHCDILLHKPHPQKELKEYVVKDLRYILEQEGFFNE